jgi:hypothetical protein
LKKEKRHIKDLRKIFNKIAAISQISGKRGLLRYRKPLGHQPDMTKIKPLHRLLQFKQLA